MYVRKHALGVGVLLALGTSAPAFAQPAGNDAQRGQPYPTCTKKVEPGESEAAHAKYLAGKVDYDEGNYEAAISQFRQAYTKDCTKHELLVIISRAYELKADRLEAIRALETYLERVPSSPDASAHRSRIENLRKQHAAAPPPPPPAPATPPPSAAPTTAAPPSEAQQGHTIYPWILVGAGVATAAVGVVLVATAPSNPSNCNRQSEVCVRLADQSDADYQADRDQAGRAKTQPVAGWVVTGTGAALAVGGLLWHFLEPTGPKDASAKTKVQPQLGPGYGGVALTGRF